MSDEIVPPEIFTTLSFESKFTRVIGNIIVPSTFKVSVDFEPQEGTTEDGMDRGFTRIKYWLDNIVNKCIAFSHENETAIAMFIENGSSRVGNVLMITPEEPDDQHLAALFQAKLTALADGAMTFGTLELRSDNIMNLTFTLIGDAELMLPDMKEWMDSDRSYFDKPWWNRCDGSTLDIVPPEGADLSIKPVWEFPLEFLDKPRGTTQMSDEKNPQVVRPEFRPTVIDGGKSKD